MPARSMTGFGAAARDGAHAKVRVEVKAVNHRFLDVSLNLPAALHAKEAELRALVAEHVRRARVDLWVSWEPKAESAYHVKVNRELLAERADVTEEVVRLRTHLERARALLEAADELGKPFDFLLQELSREVNTLGSKSRSPETTGYVLAIKAEIEKIREQARNLE